MAVNSIFGVYSDQNMGFFAGQPYLQLSNGYNFSTLTTEAQVARVVRAGGTNSLFTCNVFTNAQTATSNMVLRNQSGALNCNIAVTASTTGIFQDATHTDTQIATDKVDMRCTFPANANFVLTIVHIKWAPGTGAQNFQGSWSDTGGSWTASTSSYVPFTGRYVAADTTEANRQALVRVGGVYSNLATYIATNGNANTATQTFRNNTVSGNQIVSITAAATGYLEDTTHTDTVVSGDKVNAILTLGSGTISFHPVHTQIMMTLGGTQYDVLSDNRGAILSNAADQFLPLLGQNTQFTTELNGQLQYPFGESFLKLRCNVGTVGTGVSLKFRVNGVDGNQSVAFSGAGWNEDTTHTDTIVISDKVDAHLAHGSGNATSYVLAVTAGSFFNTETGTAVLTFNGISFSGAAKDGQSGTGALHFGGISIHASGGTVVFTFDSQSSVLVLSDGTPDVRDTQSAILVLSSGSPDVIDTQSAVLILANRGTTVTFSLFKNDNFHDWTDVDYSSYLETYWETPELIDWSSTPYSYFFLKNAGPTDNSLNVQYFWDFSKKDN